MIKNFYREKKPVFSLEVFPPKEAADISVTYNALDEMKKLQPDFISVTYGAGGGTRKRTVEIASYIQNTCQIEALAHLTCAALDEAALAAYLEELQKANVKNVLALRGDMPKDMTKEAFDNRCFLHAKHLIEAIPKHAGSSIGAACYPEVHPEASSKEADISFLKEKEEAGADFFISQLFFDNYIFYDFMERVQKAGIRLPISAGIMPITSLSQFQRITRFSSSGVPDSLSRILTKYQDSPEDIKKAGLEFSAIQIDGLVQNGVDGIHLYTMNKPDVAASIYNMRGKRR